MTIKFQGLLKIHESLLCYRPENKHVERWWTYRRTHGDTRNHKNSYCSVVWSGVKYTEIKESSFKKKETYAFKEYKVLRLVLRVSKIWNTIKTASLIKKTVDFEPLIRAYKSDLSCIARKKLTFKVLFIFCVFYHLRVIVICFANQFICCGWCKLPCWGHKMSSCCSLYELLTCPFKIV